IFGEILSQFAPQFGTAKTIVEVGGGQGWASCAVKRRYPAAQVTLTDAVEAAVSSAPIWERVFACALDRAVAAPAQSLPVADDSTDLVFCYAAAHHFVDHVAALREAHRVLALGGTCLWLYEPTSSSLFHGVAEARVNRKRVDVPEHVLVPTTVMAQARSIGFDATIVYAPSGLRRGRFESLYYSVLAFVPVLARLLPCTAHFAFKKRR
ncbi:MAG TPA: class I SAM-dependent methyltransferase, partial [Gemmatimonadaceae bacterium]|nr:class I SAM-dependent methyltransferase [Gemmatimonadaceae bacterium]